MVETLDANYLYRDPALSPRAQSESLKEEREISRPLTRLDKGKYDQTERKAREIKINGLDSSPHQRCMSPVMAPNRQSSAVA